MKNFRRNFKITSGPKGGLVVNEDVQERAKVNQERFKELMGAYKEARCDAKNAKNVFARRTSIRLCISVST